MKQLGAALLAITTLLMASGCVTTTEDGAVVHDKGPDMQEASRLNSQLGIDYLRRGNVELALEKLERAAQQDPKNADAQLGLALVYDQRKDPEAAEKAYRKAISLDRDDPDIQNNFGIFLCRNGQRAEAERLFTAAANNPDYRTPEAALTNAGVCVLQSGDDVAAERYFRASLDHNRGFSEALIQMAAVSYQRKEYLQARAFLQRYEQVGRPTAASLLMASKTEAALGDQAAAARYAQRLRDEFPTAAENSQL